MPYIHSSKRDIIDSDINNILATFKKNFSDEDRDGVLNYIITKLLKSLYGYKYISYNAAIGVLESAKMEYYRQVVAYYEDGKRKENGDV